jgi:hypothetical protein
MLSAGRFSLFFLLCLAVVILVHPHRADAQNCPRHKTQMILQPELTKTRLFTGSARRMTEWRSGHTQNIGVVLGLGGGEIGTKFQSAFNYSVKDDGRVCVQLDKVKAIFFAHPRIYVASDYKKGSCEYEAILEHEKRHIKALVDFYEPHVDRFQVHMGRIAKRIPMFGPVPREQVPSIKQQLMDYVMGEYYAYQNSELMTLQRAQRKIDSPSEYRGVAAKCENW